MHGPITLDIGWSMYDGTKTMTETRQSLLVRPSLHYAVHESVGDGAMPLMLMLWTDLIGAS